LYHFGEERFRGDDPKGVLKDYFNKVCLPWEYTTYIWQEEEVHRGARSYDEVAFKRRGKPLGRIADEDKAREEAKKKAKEDAIGRTSPISASAHSGSTVEEETLVDKKRRKKEKVHKKNKDIAKKQRKI